MPETAEVSYGSLVLRENKIIDILKAALVANPSRMQEITAITIDGVSIIKPPKPKKNNKKIMSINGACFSLLPAKFGMR